MIILPLIERELRARARSRALYWTRFAVALGGLLFCLPMAQLYGGMPFGPKAVGHSVFTGIVLAAFMLSCCAGFVTVDSISRERREGTLGLLYLTRVKALDVLLGSFGAAGIACVCALMAFLPVIMLPVLTGGVTGGEAFRMMLVLLDTLLLSLAAGLWASAGARGWFKSARALVGMLLLIVVVPSLPWLRHGVDFLSPLAALGLADDNAYGFNTGRFWMSLGAVLAISWLLLIAAGFRLRRAMRDDNGMTESSGAARRKPAVARQAEAEAQDEALSRGFDLVSWNIRFPRMKATEDPVRWVVRRQRGMKAVIWVGTLIWVLSTLGLISLVFLWLGRSVASYVYSFTPIYLVLMCVRGCLFGWAASRFFVGGRRSGELELLLTSPMGAKTVVSSQWKELKRLFAWPVIIVVACSLWSSVSTNIRIHSMTGQWYSSFWLIVNGTYETLSCLNILFGTGALIWMALWFGLTARSQAVALVQIVLVSQAVPYLVNILGREIMSPLASLVLPLIYNVGTGAYVRWQHYLAPWDALLPSVIVLFYYLWLIRWARRQLAGDLRNASPVPISLRRLISGAGARLNSVVSKSRNWPPAPEG